MSDHKYNYQKKIIEDRCAKAYKTNQRISTKYSIEISNYLKNKPLSKAIKILDDIEHKRDYLPLVKFRKKVAHRKGRAKRGTPTGRWPVKCAKTIKSLLEEVKANAENKDLDTEKLRIIHMFANKGFTRTSLQPLGAIGGKMRKSKSTNIEVIVLEE
jgi:large subunit ribosomal protein L22